jgi:hypothetical protein
MKTTLLALFAAAGVANAQLVVEYSNNFVAPEGSTGEDYTLSIGFEVAGNGDEGAGYYDAGRAALVVQSYGSRQVEIGIVSFAMSGLTMDAGTEYTINAVVVDDLQNWSLGRNMFLGINESANRPGTPSPFASYTPDYALNEVELPGNDDFIEGPFQMLSWTFTPASMITDPLFVFGTSAEDIGIFLDTRQRLYSIEITSGEDSGTLPGCTIADVAEPYGILDLADISAFVGSFTGGCP